MEQLSTRIHASALLGRAATSAGQRGGGALLHTALRFAASIARARASFRKRSGGAKGNMRCADPMRRGAVSNCEFVRSESLSAKRSSGRLRCPSSWGGVFASGRVVRCSSPWGARLEVSSLCQTLSFEESLVYPVNVSGIVSKLVPVSCL